MNIKPIGDWLKGTDGPVIISGPCSAESEDQVISTARALHELNSVCVFRAGVWKPRTRPGTFEGRGTEALKWLQEVKRQTGMFTTVEVGNPTHVEDCLKHGIDILWVGARTTVNPFYVQEIAEALIGVDIPVIVKNPIHPDISLWIGALERFNNSGIDKLVAAHRGFYSYEQSIYRNAPKWEIPIELKTKYRDLPIICDPSHISGNTALIPEIAQRALDLGMDGLMIESHINPAEALSDAEQQLRPEELNTLIKNLRYREATIEDQEFEKTLEEFRKLIDDVDTEILEALSKRMEIVEKIGDHKHQKNVTILQIERWFEVLRSRIASGETLHLDKAFIKNIFQLIHKESIQKQTEIVSTGLLDDKG